MSLRQVMVTTPIKTQSEVSYNLSQKLGEGNFGAVYKGFISNTSAIVAVKKVNAQDWNEMNDTQREIDIMEKLSTPKASNIVCLHGSESRGYSFTIAMTYVGNGSLHDWLIGKKQPYFNPQQQLKVMRGIACGLAYMHELNVLHCDIKPPNVMIDDHLEPQICDFGLSKRTDADDLYAISGSPLYMAPELLLAKYCSMLFAHTDKSDIYSFSLLCWSVVTKSVSPFDAIDKIGDPNLLIEKVVDRNEREDIPLTCPVNVAEFIRLGWDEDPAIRPTAKQAVVMLADANQGVVVDPVAAPSLSPMAHHTAHSAVASPQPHQPQQKSNVLHRKPMQPPTITLKSQQPSQVLVDTDSSEHAPSSQPLLQAVKTVRKPVLVDSSQTESVSCFACLFSGFNFKVSAVNHEKKAFIHTRVIL